MCAMASEITKLVNVYSTVYSGTNQRKHQSSDEFPSQMASNAEYVSIFPFDDVIMQLLWLIQPYAAIMTFFEIQ